MKKKIALYPGSFDPITNGHMDIIYRSLSLFDKIIVGIAHNTEKEAMFTVEERLDIIGSIFKDEPRVEVDSFKGLTVEYATSKGACALLRGLRAVADFEYELQMANMNRMLTKDLETIFMMTSEKSFFVSSRNVKEVALLNGDIKGLVPKQVALAIAKKIKSLR